MIDICFSPEQSIVPKIGSTKSEKIEIDPRQNPVVFHWPKNAFLKSLRNA